MTHLLERPTGKVLIRVNAIDTSKAIIKELIDKKIYKKSEIHQFYSSLDIKNSKTYKGLAYNSEFSGHYKIVFTTAMIDEGVSIDQMGFTDIIFIETSYNPRPEAIKQFFARFRNDDPNRNNYLYLKQKKVQTPTRYNPTLMFKKDLYALAFENDDELAKEVLTTYNNLFSNNRYYYNNQTVNKYYLAYATTEALFQNYNTEQLLDHLKSNYNLAFRVNKEYEVEKIDANTKEHIKQVKQKVATMWMDERVQVHQVLLYHTQNPSIANGIIKQQIRTDEDIVEFVRGNIKHFETFFIREKELQSLGVNDKLEYLIEKNMNDEVTLLSDHKYKTRVQVLKVDKAIKEPKTNADKRTAQQFLHFAQWCALRKRFTHKQMYDELRNVGVVNHNAFKNEAMLFGILSSNFNLDVKRNKRTSQITCKSRVV